MFYVYCFCLTWYCNFSRWRNARSLTQDMRFVCQKRFTRNAVNNLWCAGTAFVSIFSLLFLPLYVWSWKICSNYWKARHYIKTSLTGCEFGFDFFPFIVFHQGKVDCLPWNRRRLDSVYWIHFVKVRSSTSLISRELRSRFPDKHFSFPELFNKLLRFSDWNIESSNQTLFAYQAYRIHQYFSNTVDKHSVALL